MERFAYSFQFFCKEAAVVCAYDPQRKQCQVCKIVRELNAERLREALIRKRAELKASAETMPTRQSGDCLAVASLMTRRLNATRKVKRRFVQHLKAPHLIPVGVYAWNHPEMLEFVETRELGANKDLTDPRDVKNV